MTFIELKQRVDLYEKLMRLDKPVGILLLLWPTLWGLWLASNGAPNLMLLWIFTLGTVLMRSAGCVINDYADHDFDAHVERTKDRPIATGQISRKEALLLSSGLTIMAGLMILPLDKLVWKLSVIAVFLAASYPFTKRFFALPQAYLGVAFGFGIPMAYAAVQGMVPSVAWWLLLANVFWAIAYDTEYAMVDREDDLKIGIRTAAITFGKFDVAAVMLCYALALVILCGVGYMEKLRWGFFAGIFVAIIIVGYHYTLIRGRERAACFKAFRHNVWIGAVIFAGLVMELNLLPRVGF
jgi:4-hydroxybenzoate polyprenyltransferase